MFFRQVQWQLHIEVTDIIPERDEIASINLMVFITHLLSSILCNHHSPTTPIQERQLGDKE